MHCLKSYFIAAQMWNLAVYLPLMIGDKVPNGDKEWECYLVLLDILKISTSRLLSADMVHYLGSLIKIYLQSFRDLFPLASIIPKQHYMIHLPSQIFKLVFATEMYTCLYLCATILSMCSVYCFKIITIKSSNLKFYFSIG